MRHSTTWLALTFSPNWAEHNRAINLQLRGITAQEDRFALECTSDMHVNGHHYNNTYHYLFETRDGKIAHPRFYLDTFLTKKLFEWVAETSEDAMHYDYIDKINDGLVGEAGDELFKVISQWKVSADERPNKQIRFDFMLMHTVTTATFLPIYLKTEWIKPESKARLVEWPGRSNLLLYAECGAPEPRPEELKIYKPLHPSGWNGVLQRACEYEDDGHTSKFVRGIATVAQMTEQYDERLGFKLTRQEDFLTIAHMIIDSVENFDKSADNEVHEVRKGSLYPRITEPEVQLMIARWPRYVGFE
ncbi:hypothetical protein THAR02_00032 [Trichoderma harzianum]|uniref:Uncharacterized protein n=1 Tax=Trichoderma harzianum TaxID=5544 RepID=A0A0G0ATS4_TRIHA|nr:hypothetical protein THAR02_00032 [Trichoderma harzianum]